jgi:UDP-N-acetylglucosamine--N-acetylmuramyl-(pentapeptide) pyrophosphoryl-undecaprenol N-acetylglucosamine transferase
VTTGATVLAGTGSAAEERAAGTGRRFAVITGGGTGGHLMPVLSVARALVRRGHHPGSIEVVASRRGKEGELLADSEFPATLLPGRGLLRRLDAASLQANAASLAALARATGRALALLRAWRPQVVVTVGGYASFPAGLAATVLRIPVVLVNTDAVPGLAHRVLAPFSAASAVAFPGTPLPRAVVTGTPLRPEMGEVDRSDAGQRAARRALSVPEDRHLVVAFGGSLGARRINEAVASLARRWAGRGDLALFHVVGQRDFRAEMAGAHRADPLWYRAVPYFFDMPLLYSAADVMVCRAGAMTVAEVARAGVPAIFVPLPGAPGDHQSANAAVLVERGAALRLDDASCDAEQLAAAVLGLLSDPLRRASLSAGARALGHAHAADKVAELVEEVVAGRGR